MRLPFSTAASSAGAVDGLLFSTGNGVDAILVGVIVGVSCDNCDDIDLEVSVLINILGTLCSNLFYIDNL